MLTATYYCQMLTTVSNVLYNTLATFQGKTNNYDLCHHTQFIVLWSTLKLFKSPPFMATVWILSLFVTWQARGLNEFAHRHIWRFLTSSMVWVVSSAPLSPSLLILSYSSHSYYWRCCYQLLGLYIRSAAYIHPSFHDTKRHKDSKGRTFNGRL